MPRLEYFLVCGSCALDQLTGRISVFDVFIEVRPQTMPAVFPRLVTVASFVLDPADMGRDFQFTVQATLPSGRPGVISRANFIGREKHHNIISNWIGLAIDAQGVLRFEARLNEEHVAQHEITVYPADPARFEGNLVPNFVPPQPPGEQG